jgi:hypothetical protein
MREKESDGKKKLFLRGECDRSGRGEKAKKKQ